MSLITLKDVGKIYVSEGNVSVGIRGVNLSFDKGEFVAVTGKSGSGKSTLLNVISGMDSYEEGELFIEGQPTSHYLQPEWEAYREKYVSFIFQDYNIIESFTVLQNVELALMHIDDKRERRRRALDLIGRVGLTSQLRQKGSKLSGGQKQRTVIARALAKDSPIILADEPTGNLDSVSSREIIELLREVSRDKLLIVVTHNFEQVEHHATRHVRIFDGAVESDHVLRPAAVPPERTDAVPEKKESKKKSERARRRKNRRNGVTLGRSIFTSKPKLSLFLCLLMIVGTLGVFSVTSMCGGAAALFTPYHMFEHIDGRLVVAKQSGGVLTDEEIKAISEKYGAKDSMRFDILLDAGNTDGISLPPMESTSNRPKYLKATYTYGKDYGDGIVGRYPETADEVFLYLPVYLQPIVGKDSLKVQGVFAASMSLKLVGVKYYYDNNLTAECLFTDEGFRVATAMHYLASLQNGRNNSIYATVKAGGFEQRVELKNLIPSFDMPADKVYVSSRDYANTVNNLKGYGNVSTSVSFEARYERYNYYSGMDGSEIKTFGRTFTEAELTNIAPTFTDYFGYDTQSALIISDELLCEIAESVLRESYKQVSFFFEDDAAARAAVGGLRDEGYIAVVSDTTYEPDAILALVSVAGGFMMAFMWVITVVFLAFFINLCTGRTLGAFKGDMAIMRSMGIQVKVIRIAMYVRMLLSLIPAFIMVAAMAVLIFTTPKFNEYFTYLYAWQYALIFLGMIIITVRVTHKQIRKLFGESVKKALKGGAAE